MIVAKCVILYAESLVVATVSICPEAYGDVISGRFYRRESPGYTGEKTQKVSGVRMHRDGETDEEKDRGEERGTKQR